MKFDELYLVASASSAGISSRQGTHQLAQKLTNSAFPLKSAMVMSLPAASLNASV